MEVTIKRGDSVSWLNGDSVQHTVTSNTGSELNSALLPKGATYKHTFNDGRVIIAYTTAGGLAGSATVVCSGIV